MEALISRMIALGPAANLPPHIVLESVLPRSLSVILLGSYLLVVGCDREGQGGGQPVAQLPQDVQNAEMPQEGMDRSHTGELMPAVNLSSEQGEVLNLGALQGTPVLLNIWATWCAPCVKEMPQLDTLAAEYDGRLRVVTASQDAQGAKVVLPFFERAGLSHLEPWLDPENLLMEGLEVEALPVTILYDSVGKEVWRMHGAYDWSSENAFTLIEESVSPPPVPPGA